MNTNYNFEQSKKITRVFILIGCFLLMTCVFDFAVYNYKKANYSKAEGTSIELTAHSKSITKYRSGSSSLGTESQHHSTYSTTIQYCVGSDSYTIKSNHAYPEGMGVIVYYNPQKPSEAFVEFKSVSYQLLFAMLSFFVAFIISRFGKWMSEESDVV